MRVELSKLADRDLGDIYRYSYERFGEAQAGRYYASLWRCFAFLADHPTIGRIRTEFQPPARSHQHQRHVVFYDIADSHILIVRVLHERMDIDRHMRDEDAR